MSVSPPNIYRWLSKTAAPVDALPIGECSVLRVSQEGSVEDTLQSSPVKTANSRDVPDKKPRNSSH